VIFRIERFLQQTIDYGSYWRRIYWLQPVATSARLAQLLLGAAELD
jgi:hypothetical protein